MFSQKKRFWRGKTAYVLLLAVLGLIGIIAMQTDNASYDAQKQAMGEHQVSDEMPSDTVEENENAEKSEDMPTSKGSKSSGIEDDGEAYYLVKEEDGIVSVYYCDEEGYQSLYQNTMIPFSVMSEADQRMFKRGVKLKDEGSLNDFLQDFDN